MLELRLMLAIMLGLEVGKKKRLLTEHQCNMKLWMEILQLICRSLKIFSFIFVKHAKITGNCIQS